MDQSWFEMSDVRHVQRDPWITLRRSEVVHGDQGTVGATEEFVGVSTLAVKNARPALVEEWGWDDLGLDPHRSGFSHGSYVPAEIRKDCHGRYVGLNLVLNQFFDGEAQDEWHLAPDLVIALELVRDGDSWFRPKEGWIEVVRLRRSSDGVCSIEIRAEFLSDYLVARGLSLYLSSYLSREEVFKAPPSFWPTGEVSSQSGRDTFEGWVIKEQGGPFAGALVTHVGRTDLDSGDPVPMLGDPEDDDVVVRTGIVPTTGPITYLVRGELWRTEWFDPGRLSIRVRGDSDRDSVSFAVDASGRRMSGDDLRAAGLQWLWFEPEVINHLVRGRRGAGLTWYTRETGRVGATATNRVHFGTNPDGKVVVLAKDIGNLPRWEQRIWGAHNIVPVGGMAQELAASQVKAVPARTSAPEGRIALAIEKIFKEFQTRFGEQLLRDHHSSAELLIRVHRFRAVDQGALFALAKDTDHLFNERLQLPSLHKVAPPPSGKKLGTLKSLEAVLATIINEADARTLMSPLFGIYDLRIADAHLASSTPGSAYMNAKIDVSAPPVVQGLQMLESFVTTLEKIGDVLAKPAAPAVQA